MKFGSCTRGPTFTTTPTPGSGLAFDFSLHDYPIKSEELLTVSLHEYTRSAEPEKVAEARCS